MSRKITSEPDNQVSLFTELQKEFAHYSFRLSQKIIQILQQYPKQAFLMMLVCMMISVILAFSVKPQKKVPTSYSIKRSGTEITSGLGQVIHNGNALKEMLDLQARVGLILKKDSLTAGDSLILKEALRQLESIQQQLNPKP